MKPLWRIADTLGSHRRLLALAISVIGLAIILQTARGFDVTAVESKQTKSLNLVLRDRIPAPGDNGRIEVRERAEGWDPPKTAIIICDMWDLHHCKRAR